MAWTYKRNYTRWISNYIHPIGTSNIIIVFHQKPLSNLYAPSILFIINSNLTTLSIQSSRRWPCPSSSKVCVPKTTTECKTNTMYHMHTFESICLIDGYFKCHSCTYCGFGWGGKKGVEVAAIVGIPVKVVQRLVKKFRENGTYKSNTCAKKYGKKLSDRDVRGIKRVLQANCRITLSDITNMCPTNCTILFPSKYDLN